MREITKAILEDAKTICCYGAVGTGKSCLIYTLINLLRGSGRNIYFFKHPQPNLIEEMGYENISSIERLEKLHDSVLWIDEPQLSFKLYDKHSNKIIANICSMCRQLNIILFISSSDTRTFTKHNESFFDLWCVKSIDFDMVKQGSKIKKIISNHSLFDPAGFNIEKNEYLASCRSHPEINGMHLFEKPEWFTDQLSRPYYKTAKKVANETANKSENKIKVFSESGITGTDINLQVVTNNTKDLNTLNISDNLNKINEEEK